MINMKVAEKLKIKMLMRKAAEVTAYDIISN